MPEVYEKGAVLPFVERMRKQEWACNGSLKSDATRTAAEGNYGGWLSGYKNPSWRSQVARNVCATTSLQAWRETFAPTPGTLEIEKNSFAGCSSAVGTVLASGLCISPVMRPTDPSGYSEVLADNRAKSELVSSIRGMERRFDGLTFAGELRETLRMLRNPFRSLREGLVKFVSIAVKRSTRLRRADQARRVVADTWLEQAFGWRPFVRDIQAAAEAALDLGREHGSRIRGFGQEKTIQTVPRTYASGGVVMTLGGYTFDEVHEMTVKVIYLGAWRSTSSLSTGRYGFDPWTLGLTLDSVVPTLWELLPYSFLVDYFSNLGDVIDAAALRTRGVVWIQKTVVKEHKISSSPMIYLPGNYQSHTNVWNSPSYTWTRSTVSRNKYEGSLIPSLTLRLPTGSLQWLNMGALTAASAGARRMFRSKGWV